MSGAALADEDGSFTAVTRRVYLIDANGNAQLLTNEHLAGSSLTLASVRAMLLARGAGGRNRRGAQQDDEEEEGEDEDDDDDGNPYWGPSRKATKQWYEAVIEPKEAGVNLERGGEFGPVSHCSRRCFKMTQNADDDRATATEDLRRQGAQVRRLPTESPLRSSRQGAECSSLAQVHARSGASLSTNESQRPQSSLLPNRRWRSRTLLESK